MDGFTIGCDWVGYCLSLSNSVDLTGSDISSSADLKEAVDDATDLLTGNGIHMTRLYVGWAF